eukprot:GGOE01001276.1.p1 GENE.GGOE01001276.1~~GGOE01001276.1.p1  ORF type:complete len:523 (-),score=105.37 GGOE01001276.1:153-1721(-)
MIEDVLKTVLKAKDEYSVLRCGGATINEFSPLEEVRKAYLKLSVRIHPDKLPGQHLANDAFQKLLESYERIIHSRRCNHGNTKSKSSKSAIVQEKKQQKVEKDAVHNGASTAAATAPTSREAPKKRARVHRPQHAAERRTPKKAVANSDSSDYDTSFQWNKTVQRKKSRVKKPVVASDDSSSDLPSLQKETPAATPIVAAAAVRQRKRKRKRRDSDGVYAPARDIPRPKRRTIHNDDDSSEKTSSSWNEEENEVVEPGRRSKGTRQPRKRVADHPAPLRRARTKAIVEDEDFDPQEINTRGSTSVPPKTKAEKGSKQYAQMRRKAAKRAARTRKRNKQRAARDARQKLEKLRKKEERLAAKLERLQQQKTITFPTSPSGPERSRSQRQAAKAVDYSETKTEELALAEELSEVRAEIRELEDTYQKNFSRLTPLRGAGGSRSKRKEAPKSAENPRPRKAVRNLQTNGVHKTEQGDTWSNGSSESRTETTEESADEDETSSSPSNPEDECEVEEEGDTDSTDES